MFTTLGGKRHYEAKVDDQHHLCLDMLTTLCFENQYEEDNTVYEPQW